MYKINNYLLFHKYVVVARRCKRGCKDILAEIVTLSKAFARVDSNDDFLLIFELEYSETLDDTGLPKES